MVVIKESSQHRLHLFQKRLTMKLKLVLLAVVGLGGGEHTPENPLHVKFRQMPEVRRNKYSMYSYILVRV